MRTISITIFFTFLTIHLISQTVAITETGDTVFLYDNGTWSFEPFEDYDSELPAYFKPESAIRFDTSSIAYAKPAQAKKAISDENKMFSIHYDDKKWKRIPPATLNPDAQFAFEGKGIDVWAVVISEETIIPKENMLGIALENMIMNGLNDAEILSATFKDVNDSEILHGKIKSSLQGIDFVFDSYYFSNDKGTLQFVVWTSAQLTDKYGQATQDLLNGLVIH